MISPRLFLKAVEESGVRFFTGVPDSLLKDLCACISDCCPEQSHQIVTNEGSAVALAIGEYLATGRPSVVYMQNSGLGNALNPLTSLASPQVYGVPMVLVIGWRGELLAGGSQLPDEPQHIHQGKITVAQLGLLEIPYVTLTPETTSEEAAALFRQILQISIDQSTPVALVVRKDSFESFPVMVGDQTRILSRERAIDVVVGTIPSSGPVVATTGMTSRELYELRRSRSQTGSSDFLTVGGMGHASQIAAGIARAKPELLVTCIDGDGSVLMHTGALAVSSGSPNLLHVMINNQAHDSVGGQPTPQKRINFCALASAMGYEQSASVHDEASLREAVERLIAAPGSRFLEVHCRKGARKDLGRPRETPAQNKSAFMKFLRHD